MSGPRVMTASADVKVSRFVQLDSSNPQKVKQSGSGEACFGIAQAGGYQAPIPSVTDDPALAAAAGISLNVFTDGMQCLLVLGSGGATTGNFLKSDTNGAGVAISGSGAENYGAIALAAGAAGELIPVQVVSNGRTYA